MTAAASDHERYLATLQRLLEIPATDMKAALTQASDALAAVLAADKVALEISPYDLSKGRITFRQLETRVSTPPRPRY